MFGINGGELIIILVLAVVIIGPERLPQFAEQLAHWVRKGKQLFAQAKEKVDEELGPEIGDVDWAKLDPRQYDPRKIVRETLLEDTVLDPAYAAKQAAKAAGAAVPAAALVAGGPAAASGTPKSPYAGSGFERYQPLDAGKPAPFDPEAT